jgi:magnesium-transporting ATPase (P-type)
LFTDFNYFVSLSDAVAEGLEPEYVSQGISKLPRGIPAIRRHLREVDNVPLLVSLFTDCTPKTAREMIRIYQEEGETVLCMGSSLNVENIEAFMQANLAISLDPVPARECEYKTFSSAASSTKSGELESYSESREFALSSAITTMPCALPLPSTTDLNQFLVLIAQARRLTRGVQQSLWFAFTCYLTLFLIMLLSSVADTPPLLTVYQMLWLIYIIIPLLSVSLMAAPREPDLMRRFAYKNENYLQDRWRYVGYYAIRFALTIICYILFFLWLVHASFRSTIGYKIQDSYYWQSGNCYVLNEPLYSSTLLAVQNYSLVMLIYILCWHSTGYIHRFHSIVKLHPFSNVVWLTTCFIVIGLQVVFACVSMAANGTSVDTVNMANSDYFPAAVWPLALVAWPAWILCVDEICKIHDRRYRDMHHQQDRQQFDTILGRSIRYNMQQDILYYMILYSTVLYSTVLYYTHSRHHVAY